MQHASILIVQIYYQSVLLSSDANTDVEILTIQLGAMGVFESP
jgi:hypothetical protein